MTTIPTNVNLASQSNFKLIISSLPSLEFFCTEFNIPSISITPVQNIIMGKKTFPLHGDKLDFAPFTVTFIIDEEFLNYLSIYNWMRGLTSPEGFDEFIAQKNLTSTFPIDGLYSDAIVLFQNNNLAISKVFTFHQIIPTNLSDINFSINNEDSIPIVCSVTFDYSDFVLE